MHFNEAQYTIFMFQSDAASVTHQLPKSEFIQLVPSVCYILQISVNTRLDGTDTSLTPT